MGPVGILVNCAGVMYYTMMKNLHEDEWERTIEVNCKGAMNCVPGMLEREGGTSSPSPQTPGAESSPASRSIRRASSSWRRSPRGCGWRPRARG